MGFRERAGPELGQASLASGHSAVSLLAALEPRPSVCRTPVGAGRRGARWWSALVRGRRAGAKRQGAPSPGTARATGVSPERQPYIVDGSLARPPTSKLDARR